MNSSTNYGKLSFEKFSTQYMVIDKPGSKDVIAMRSSQPVPSRSKINEGGEAVIVNLNVVMAHNLQEVMQKFEEAGPQGIEYSELNGLTETFNIESNSGKFDSIPGKREPVKITVGWHTPTSDTAKHKGEKILVVTDLIVSPPQKPRSIAEYIGNNTLGEATESEVPVETAEDDSPF